MFHFNELELRLLDTFAAKTCTLINFGYNDPPFPQPLRFYLYNFRLEKEDRNKTIHSERLCQRKPFDGNYPHSFNDLFLRVCTIYSDKEFDWIG